MEQEFQQQSLISSIDRVDPFLLSLGELVALTYIYIYTVYVMHMYTREDFAHFSSESLTWIILKTILCLVLDLQRIHT